jgi:hypothetical protein
MQGVAAAALTLQQVGYTLDATTQSGRRQLLGISAVVWAMLVYGRGFRCVWLVYKIVLALHASGSFAMLVGGVVAAAMMCTVNSLFLADAPRKLYKSVYLTLQPEPKEARLGSSAPR